MSAHVRGSKRLKIIQNYLNGKEDDEYEVFPTKTEGKYIVRKRTESIAKPIEEPIAKLKPTPQQFYDPTINIEILNQLKLLGEEMKNSREKKEQKRMIKEVVNKQIRRPWYNYMQPQYIQESNDKSFDLAQAKACEVEQEELPNEPPPMQQPITRPYRRRNNIFSDMY